MNGLLATRMVHIVAKKQNTWCRICHTLVTKGDNCHAGTARLRLQSRNFMTGTSLGYSAKVQRKVAPSETSPKHASGLYVENPYTDKDISEDDPLVQNLFNGLKSGQRAALARSITLVESTHPRKRAQSQVLLSLILKHTQKMRGKSLKRNNSFRIGMMKPSFKHFISNLVQIELKTLVLK